MLTSWHLREKSREVCIKARSNPASLEVISQVTKHTTVKWPIQLHSWLGSNFVAGLVALQPLQCRFVA